MIEKEKLIKKVGVSYGELHRWIREDLIDSDWIQKSKQKGMVVTSFDESKTVSRIEKIKNLLEKYSVFQVKSILSEGIKNRMITKEEAMKSNDLNPVVLASIFADKNIITFQEYLLIEVFSRLKEFENLPDTLVLDSIKHFGKHLENKDINDCSIHVLKSNGKPHILLSKDDICITSPLPFASYKIADFLKKKV